MYLFLLRKLITDRIDFGLLLKKFNGKSELLELYEYQMTNFNLFTFH